MGPPARGGWPEFFQGHGASCRPSFSGSWGQARQGDRKMQDACSDGGAGRRQEEANALPGADDDRCEGSAPPLAGGSQCKEDRRGDRNGSEDGRTLHGVRRAAGAAARSTTDGGRGSRGGAVRSSAGVAATQRGVARGRPAQGAD